MLSFSVFFLVFFTLCQPKPRELPNESETPAPTATSSAHFQKYHIFIIAGIILILIVIFVIVFICWIRRRGKFIDPQISDIEEFMIPPQEGERFHSATSEKKEDQLYQ